MTEADPDRPRLVAASDRSLLVSFGERIGLEAHLRVRRLLHALDADPLEGVADLVPAYASLLIHFDPRRLDHARLEAHARALLERLPRSEPDPPRLVEVPVAYGGEHGPDLDEAARLCGLAAERLVEAHCGATYRVYFLGFVPGFAYLGDLPEAIHCARLNAPRRRVPAGSVGIAGAQTGVYPLAAPGGWRLIGRTPWRMFDPRRRPMSRLEMGDRVRFTPIDPGRFAALEER